MKAKNSTKSTSPCSRTWFKSRIIIGPAFRLQTAAPRHKQCILRIPRPNVLNTLDHDVFHLQFLRMITTHHGFQISHLNFCLLLDPIFWRNCGNVFQIDNVLVQLRHVGIAYGMSIEPGRVWDPEFPATVAATMRELPHLEYICLDHGWWSWHWRPVKLIDLLCNHKWPNLRSCILKLPFATCSQVKRFLQPHVGKLEYLRIEGFPQNDEMNGFCTMEEARMFRLWLETELLAQVWKFVDLEGEPAGLEQQKETV